LWVAVLSIPLVWWHLQRVPVGNTAGSGVAQVHMYVVGDGDDGAAGLDSRLEKGLRTK
jgi:hypothetical protein